MSPAVPVGLVSRNTAHHHHRPARVAVHLKHRIRIRQRKRQRSSLLFEGRNWFNSMPHYRFNTRMIWRNGWMEERTLGRMDVLPYHHSPKMNVLPKSLFFKSSSLLLIGYSICTTYVQETSYVQHSWFCFTNTKTYIFLAYSLES